VQIIAVLTSAWPSSSCTVRMSYPDSSKRVANAVEVIEQRGHLVGCKHNRQPARRTRRLHTVMPLAMEDDEAPDPVDVRGFGAEAVMLEANALADAAQEPRRFYDGGRGSIVEHGSGQVRLRSPGIVRIFVRRARCAISRMDD